MSASTPLNPLGSRSRRILRRYGAGLFMAIILFFLFAPMVLIVVFAFNTSPTLSFPVKGLTLDWFRQAFADPLAIQALKNTLYLAGLSALFAGVLGTAAAFGVGRFQAKTRDRIMYAALLPSIMPVLVLGIALAVTLYEVGVTLSIKTALIGHVLIGLPFVFLTLRARLDSFDFSVVEAAHDLGASRSRAFWDITLRLVRPAIFAAALISMSLSLDEFVITSYTVGADQTLPILIWARMRTGVSPEVNALATIILCGTLLTGVLSYRLSRIRL
jgi:spermidine/putrescine transport system permease protein